MELLSTFAGAQLRAGFRSLSLRHLVHNSLLIRTTRHRLHSPIFAVPSNSKGFGSDKRKGSGKKTKGDVSNDGQPLSDVPLTVRESGAASPGALPTVSRGQVASACVRVSLLLGGLGLAGRQIEWALLGPQARPLLAEPSWLSTEDWGVLLGTVALVTASRQLLLSTWPDFREATDRSNQQALGPLQALDLVWVSCLPGVAEEMLFRGALLPALPNPWVGVALAGLVFGALHNSGGRNVAFAAWASAVGVLYGAAYVFSGNLLVPMAAHSLSNLTGSGLWRWQQLQKA